MPSLPVLVLNSGSSSIKFSVYEAGNGERRKLHEGAVDGIGTDQGSSGSRTQPATSSSINPPLCPTPQ
jgi:acetate kinase